MMLKQSFLAMSALAALTATAGAADMPVKAPRIADPVPQLSGYVELYGGAGRTKSDSTFCEIICESGSLSANHWSLGGAGRATYWWAPNYSLQLDAQGEGASHKFTGGGAFQRISSHSYLIGGHVNWRDPSRGLIGVFGGAGDTTSQFAFGSMRHGLVGLEGQAYWGPVTFYGQAGYNSTIFEVASFLDGVHAWFVRGTARAYVNPNFRLEGTVLYSDGELEVGPAAIPGAAADFQTWLWRAKAEYKFATTPFSVFALYEGSRTNAHASNPGGTLDTKTTDNRVMGGIRLYINENTLQWNDRNGTTLDILAPFSVPSNTLSFGGAG